MIVDLLLPVLLPGLLALVASTPSASCSPVGSEPGASASEHEEGPQKRHARAVERLEERLAALERSKLAEQVLASAGDVLREHPGEPWVRLGDWAITQLEANNFRHWNTSARFEESGGAIQVALETIQGYDAALDARGVHLVVVLIPSRLATDPSHLPGVELPKGFAGANPGLVRFLLELNRAGVDALDLGPAFAEALGAKDEDDLYLAYDRHWTPRAVGIAAELVAEYLDDELGLDPGDLKEGRDFVVKRERASYVVPPAMPELLPVAQEPIELRFDRILKRDGTPALQDDRESPILVLGDSFTIYYRAEACDFASRLQAAARRNLDTIGMRAGASRTVWKNVRRRRDGLAGKRAVVWLLGAGLITMGEVEPVELFPE